MPEVWDSDVLQCDALLLG